jgi:3-deoxy-D-arabino-heptulosonate 7-phosphate (DAHP) synthase
MTRLSILTIANNKLIVWRGKHKTANKWAYAIYIKKNGVPHAIICESKYIFNTELEARKDAGQTVRRCRELVSSGEVWD